MEPVVLAAALAVLGTLGAQYLAGRREEQRERRRSNDARIDELRDVLDLGAQWLASACDAHRALDDTFAGRRNGNVEEIAKMYQRAVREARRQGIRLAVRVGDHDPLCDAYDRAISHVDDSRPCFVELRDGRAYTPDDREVLLDNRGAAYVGQEEFHRRAGTLVGPRLEHPEDRRRRRRVPLPRLVRPEPRATPPE